MAAKRAWHSVELTFVEHARVLVQSQEQVRQNAQLVEVLASRQ